MSRASWIDDLEHRMMSLKTEMEKASRSHDRKELDSKFQDCISIVEELKSSHDFNMTSTMTSLSILPLSNASC